MSGRLEFLFDFASPNCYFAYRALPPILARTGAELEIQPVLLGGLFKTTNNQAPFTAYAKITGKIEYEKLEINRFIAKHKLTKFRMNPHFPVNSLLLMRGFVAAGLAGQGDAYLEAGLAGAWEEGLDMSNAETLERRLDATGLDGAGLIAQTQEPGVKQALMSATANAAQRGAFGLPTFFVGKEMFFGKERLGQVEEELARA